MKEGTKNLEFPELIEVAGTNFMGFNTDGSVPGLTVNSTSINVFKFPKLESITGVDAFKTGVLENVKIPNLKGIYSRGNRAFYVATLDENTIFGIDEITGDSWFRNAKIDGTKFLNLKKVSGQSVFYAMQEGTKNLEFPELTQITGSNFMGYNTGGAVSGISGNSTSINDFKFPKLELISGASAFEYSKIVDVDFQKLELITSNYAFRNSQLEKINFPLLKKITGNYNFNNSIIVDGILKLPSIEEIRLSNFQNIPTLLSISMPSELPKVGSGSFSNGNPDKVLITPTKEDHIKYILDNQDGKSGDHFWFVLELMMQFYLIQQEECC